MSDGSNYPRLLPTAPTLAQIRRLELVMRAEAQHEIPVRHVHAQGLYARAITVDKGVCFVGRMHRQEHLVIIASGDITVWHEGRMQRIQGPAVLVSPPGTKRAAFAHETTEWMTVHATELTDPVEIEAAVIEPELDLQALIDEEERQWLS